MNTWLDEYLDASYAPKYADQGSEQWEQVRAGRFTSSEIWKIMECGKRPMTPEELKARPKSGKGSATTQVPDPSKMGLKGLTYINQKVAEVLTGKPKPSAYAYPLVYGKETEPEAVEHFQKITGLECEEIGFQVWGDHAGGSPDRILSNGEGLEIKCPLPHTQVEYLLENKLPTEYIQQVQGQLFITGRKWCDFMSYSKGLKPLIIRVERDEEFILKLEGALNNFCKELEQIVEKIK